MTETATAGATFSIGTTEYSQTDESGIEDTDYEGDSYTLVKGISDLGEWGDAFNPIERVTIDNPRVKRLKGNRDAGQWDLIVVRDPLDAGQNAMVAAAARKFSYNMRVVLDDAPAGVGATPTTFYFRSPVFSARNQFSESDNIIKTLFGLSSNVEILELPAAEAE